MRYLDGSVSYVRADFALGLGQVRVGNKLRWYRMRTVADMVCTDDRVCYYPSEVYAWVPLPTHEEMSGMYGYRNNLELDRVHRTIAKNHNITVEGL